MALTVLCAGCSSGEREQAEAETRATLGPRVDEGAWRVSLVKLGGRWSVTLDGPGYRALSFVTVAGALRRSLSEALGERPPEPGPEAVPKAPAVPIRDGESLPDALGPPGPSPTAPAAREAATVLARDPHLCGACGGPFEVLYETLPDEPQEMAMVACPHCWATSTVLVGEAAAYTQGFRAEKIEA